MKKGEIWLADLPQQSGKEREGTRPILMLSDTKVGLTIIIPFTSSTQLSGYEYTIMIPKSNENGLNLDSTLSLFQIRSLDKKRLIHKLGNLENNHLNEINKTLKELLKL